jgi:hypothetical protein
MGLNANIKVRDIECFEHDFGGEFTTVRGIQERFGEKKSMIFGVTMKIFEDAMLQESF